MEKENKPVKHLVRGRDIKNQKPKKLSQPLNPNSEVYYTPLSEQTGMKRAHLALGQIPPGKESFIPHSHALQEEYLYILSGSGTATIGDKNYEIEKGDYMGFPCDGTPHNLINTSEKDLVYLMGGERTEVEIVEFPTVNKTMIMRKGKCLIADNKSLKKLSDSDWVKDGKK